MGKKIEWDFALVLTGANPRDVPLAHLAEYLALWSQLLGSDAAPLFGGVVRGCVSMRARVAPLAAVAVTERLQSAANDEQISKTSRNLSELLARDGLKRARVVTPGGKVLREMLPLRTTPTMTVWDSAEIDGRVFRVSGKDKTTSVALMEDGSDAPISVETTDDELAKRFAAQFKGELLRVSVRGTWTRDVTGRWTPKHLVADGFTTLEDTPLIDTMRALRDAHGNTWSRMAPEDAAAEWLRLRDGSEVASA